MAKISNTGQLREHLLLLLEEVKSGKYDQQKVLAATKVAGRINESISIELRAIVAGVSKRLGDLPIGRTETEKENEYQH